MASEFNTGNLLMKQRGRMRNIAVEVVSAVERQINNLRLPELELSSAQC